MEEQKKQIIQFVHEQKDTQLQLFRHRFCGNVVKSETFPYSHRIKVLITWQRIIHDFVIITP